MKQEIILKRNDLIKHKLNTSFDEVNIYDFKSGVISLNEIDQAEKIIFIDGDKTKVLKNINWGGSRIGSGAKLKYNEPTKTISFRVPLSKTEEIKKIIRDKVKNWQI